MGGAYISQQQAKQMLCVLCADLESAIPRGLEGVDEVEGGGGDPAAAASGRPAGGATPGPASIYMGEGLPPVPGRIADRIRRWEFVELHELLPELLTNQKVEEGPRAKTGRKRTLDMNAWLQCFAVFVSVVSREAPESVPELMAYMGTIMRASQEYEGAAWATYDVAFRRQAASTGQREWSKVNTSLYSICFTGKARRSQRCDLCLSAAHKTAECCTLDEDPDMARRVRAVESALVSFASPPQGGTPRGGRGSGSNDICRLYNGKGCYYRSCKFRHVCRTCEGNYPGSDCRAARQDNAGPLRPNPNHRSGAGGGAPY